MNDSINLQQQIAHRERMTQLYIVGAVILICVMALNIALVGITYWLFTKNAKDIAFAVALFNTVAGIITTGIAYIAPSPLQSAASRRSDSPVPAGTPSDPISTSDVHDTPADLPAPAAQDADFHPTDSVEAAMPVYDDADFQVSEPFPRGGIDNIDPDYLKEEDAK